MNGFTVISAKQQEAPRTSSMVAVGGTWYAFKRKISLFEIFERRAQVTARNIINTIFVLCVAIGFTFLLYELWKVQGSGKEFSALLSTRSPALLVFSLSLIFDLALIARFSRMNDVNNNIPRHDARALRLPVQEHTWTEVQNIVPTSQDVSRYFNYQALSVLEDAYLLARRLGHSLVLPSHILASLLSNSDVRLVFIRLGVSLRNITDRLTAIFSNYTKGETVMSVAAERLLLQSYAESVANDLQHVTPLQLIQVISREEHDAKDALYDLGVDDLSLTNTVQWVMFERRSSKQYQTWRLQALKKPKGVMNRAYTAVATPLLDTFSRDLTQAARVGALHPVIDREKEFEEIFRIFESGKKGIVLSGFPGVGKRSIVEGLAARMASEDVPEILQDRRFVELSLASLVGSSGRQGELENRMLKITEEIARSGNIVLFIENIERAIGLSTEGSENLDISEMIVQAVDKLQVPIVATTTPMTYRRVIEQSNLVSVMQKVDIQEVDANGAILILEGKTGAIEYEHDVFFTYGALSKAVELSNRYMHEQYLPEKAVSLLEEVAAYVANTKGKNSFITGEDVATIVSDRSGVPVTQVTEEESQKLLHLEERMHARIVGQDEAVSLVASALRRARAELRDQKRPIANFLFLGPTGVGKTELAKTIAEVYFGNENAMTRLDMSEYQDQASIYRLIGSPTQTSGGYLTEAVRTNPFSIILLDELEKAHPEILNVFLQVMDDGRLTDSLGRTIDFTNTIIIATSNAGSMFIQDSIRQGLAVEKIQQQLLNNELRQIFRPEFLNRFDGVIVFKPLTFEEILKIVRLLLNQVAKRLESKGITLEASDDAVKELARIGFDPVFGARPLRRTIQERVDDSLAKALLLGKVGRRDVAVLEPGGVIRIKKARSLS